MKSGHALGKIVLFVAAGMIGAGSIAAAADIAGVITLTGTPPPEKEITPLMENADCAKMHATTPTTHFYVVGPNHELADVVVSLKGAAEQIPRYFQHSGSADDFTGRAWPCPHDNRLWLF
jgi:hypothetical protein